MEVRNEWEKVLLKIGGGVGREERYGAKGEADFVCEVENKIDLKARFYGSEGGTGEIVGKVQVQAVVAEVVSKSGEGEAWDGGEEVGV